MSTLSTYNGEWTEKELRHLLHRTLFGIKESDYDYFKSKSMEECLAVLLTTLPLPPPPIAGDDPDVPLGTSYVFAPENKSREENRILVLKAWWVGLMINQERSITEKMVLFWHNHFVTEFTKVNDCRYAYQYLNLIRKNAIGNIKILAREMTINPCMLVYLNGNLSNKSIPNENYARELQELFTIGKGPDSHYTEADVKSAAKVLSGWKDDKSKIGSYFDPESHNSEDKKFSSFYNNYCIRGKYGENGENELDELMKILFDNSETAKFLCRKLYRWFVNSSIDGDIEKNIIEPLANILRLSNYELKPVLKTLFCSQHFYDPYLIGSIFKSPVDYLIGTLREFDVEFSKNDAQLNLKQLWAIALTLGYMGQDIGDPPNVAGWPAYYEFPFYYKDWINSESLSYRAKLARLLTHPEESDHLLYFDFTKYISQFSEPSDPTKLVAQILKLLCPVDPDIATQVFLVQLLDFNMQSDYKWHDLYKNYIADITNEIFKEKINSRLKNLFDNIFSLSEYQIM